MIKCCRSRSPCPDPRLHQPINYICSSQSTWSQRQWKHRAAWVERGLNVSSFLSLPSFYILQLFHALMWVTDSHISLLQISIVFWTEYKFKIKRWEGQTVHDFCRGYFVVSWYSLMSELLAVQPKRSFPFNLNYAIFYETVWNINSYVHSYVFHLSYQTNHLTIFYCMTLQRSLVQ